MTSGTTTPVLRPADLHEVRAALLDSTGPLGIAGAGTAAAWAGPLAAVDAMLDTTALTGIITHNPGDMTVAVRAGTPLRALQDELAEHRQHVALDAARVGQGATVGGLLATGDAGPAALVYGSLRDLVIGITLVLADGTIARAGGHVIKNVAGYDLAKVVHGSYGALAVVAEVVLRLHPVPKAAATLELPCALPEAAEVATRVLGGSTEPAALEWTSDGVLLLRLDGSQSALAARADRVRDVLGPAARKADGDPWARHAEITRGPVDPADTGVLRIGVRPSRLAALLASLPATAVTAGLGTGVATATVPAGAVADVHALVHAAGGTSVLRARPTGAHLPAWGPPPSAVAVLRAVKRTFDPANRLGPGRFDPWM
jgi:glycolate oxidase FAD binding subunit